jgi:hypothetical protein
LPVPADVVDAAFFLAFCGEPLARLLHLAEPGTAEYSFSRDGLIDTEAMSACLLPAWHEPGAPPPAQSALLYGSRIAYDRLLALLDRWIMLGRPRLDDVRLLVTPSAAGLPAPGTLTLPRPHSVLTLARRDGHPF